MVDRTELLVASSVGVAGVAVGFALGAAIHRLRVPPADCSQVGLEEGVVAGVPYVERMRGGAAPGDVVPMVVIFHSLGANPHGTSTMLKDIGPARLIAPTGAYPSRSGQGYRWWELGVRAAVREDPEGAAAQWDQASQRMAQFLREIVQCRPTVGRPILTGSSQGGEMTLLLASTHPRLVGSGVAVSSYLLKPFWSRKLAPTAMLHGTGDTTVPYDWAEEYAQRMIAEGAPLSFESFPSSGHAVTRDMSRAWTAAVGSQVERLGGALAA